MSQAALPRPRRGHSTARIRWFTATLDRRRAVAVVAALVVAVVVGRIVDAARDARSAWEPGPVVLVAATDLLAGDELSADNTTASSRPAGLVPLSAVGTAALGWTMSGPVAAGQVITSAQVAPDRHGLGPGEKSVTIALPLAPPPLLIGDRVEVVGIDGGDGVVRATVVSRARVAEFDDETVTLAVPSGAATTIVRYMAAGSVELIRSAP